MPNTPAPPLMERLLALLGYLGLAPLLAFALRFRAPKPFLRHHLHQAAGIWMLFLIVVLGYVLAVAYISYLIVSDRGFYTESQLESHTLNFLRRCFLAWLVFVAFGSVLALLGSDRQMPVVWRLGQRPRLRKLVYTALVCIYAGLLLLLPAAIYANQLARPDHRPDQVVMLYENNNVFPRWLFTLGFLPITRAAAAELGPGAAAVERLSAASLREALQDARFLFIGSHGGKSGLLLDGVYFTPEELVPAQPQSRLEYVYLAGCDSGTLREAWEKAFAPAKVITYDRLTAVVEHVWWMWRQGPRVVRRLS